MTLQNDLTISDVEVAIRRLNPEYCKAWDDDRQCYRLSTAAFSTSREPPHGMSIDFADLIIAAGKTPREVVTNPRFSGSVTFTVGQARAAELSVCRDPLSATATEPENPFHGEVWGSAPNKISRGQQNALLRACQWLVELPDVVIVRPPEPKRE